ncbi:peptidoglycan hydrolase-like protein with peptidoglycan-binding domain [Kibdelosporangium banguiense]|uniref:Peptidoglycan hydrolase-like protein with peptidoglycan-binding domain n=1 Tax=Kibdelosporangium banguiense TaxID=1365924 RepID=A0ABS4T9P6_9PSEU|nr:peptidoglycan-binding protein [Kibdelosporangium banguiense]MBP2321152.1 peptidoglycan hydrolase-like protein with peptidoglycan-binding domain [Kibdelosporangium banguiense]
MTDEGPRRLHRRRRIRWMIAGSAVVVALAVGTAVVLTRVGSGSAAAAPKGPAPVDTTTVTKTDLADRRSITGKLGYGTETTLAGQKQGTITGLPAMSDVLDRGKTVYKVDAKPVVLFFGDIPLYRPVGSGVTNGPDVKVIEENLKALGFGGFGAPDEKFTTATANAIKKWQKSLKLEETGTVNVGDVLITTGPFRVNSIVAKLGAPGAGDLLKYTGVNRGVSVQIKSSQRDWAKIGAKVSVAVGSKTATGTITGIAEVPPDPNPMPGSSPDSKFDVSIALDDPAAITAADATSVDVRFTADSRSAVLTVPVGALLALAEGGYAVEIVDGDRRRLAAVKPGLFSDGRVEISGPDVREGMRVVTTS